MVGRGLRRGALAGAFALAGCVGTAEIDLPGFDSGAPDATAKRDGTIDAPAESSIADTSVEDTSIADTSIADTSIADTSIADTSIADTSLSDASVTDTSLPDTSIVDASSEDAAHDASPDSPHDAAQDAPHDALPDTSTRDASDAGAVVLDFDDLPNGTITPGYRGLTWDADWYVYNTNDALYKAHSGTQFITNNVQLAAISFSFPHPVFFEGAWFSLNTGQTAHVHFDVYDAAGTKLGTSAELTEGLEPAFLPVDIAGVSKVTVVFDADFAMDDVTYIP